ncbi:hypothetical protein KY289_008464 [Solanum tuberosum]|nr:hypothetical protein KY289_008464 [Solanum tuberosum]
MSPNIGLISSTRGRCQELVQYEPSLTNNEVAERCFGPQCKSNAFGFGGGITTKELKGGTTSEAALLEELKVTQKEKESLQKRMDILESKDDRLESKVVCQSTSPPPVMSLTNAPFEKGFATTTVLLMFNAEILGESAKSSRTPGKYEP